MAGAFLAAAFAVAFFAAAFLAGVFFAAAVLVVDFFAVAFLAVDFLAAAFFVPRLRVVGGGVAAGLQQLCGPLGRDALDRVAVTLAQRGIGLAVGHVEPVPPALQHDRLAAHRVVAQLAQGRGGGLAPRRLGSANSATPRRA